MRTIGFFFMFFALTWCYSQDRVYYIGAGNTEGFSVRSSHAGFSTQVKSVYDGSGMDAKYMAATRLLAQATLGYTEDHVDKVLEIGMEPWIDQQLTKPASYTSDRLYDIHQKRKDNFYKYVDREITPSDSFEFNFPRGSNFPYCWVEANINNEDLLRQRVALALSEIFVVSINGELQERGEAGTYYYDLLIRHSFGNFRDLLFDITMSTPMGSYLSHLNNPKTNERTGIFPDENYAREIMQLFTVGLYELNQDGSRKLDDEDNFIPTYDQNDIKGLAKVFTGLGGAAWSDENLQYLEMYYTEVPQVDFDYPFFEISSEVPMKMYENWHESGQKNIINNNIIPAGGSGMEDINLALDILFNHENVGPFIGRRLIQRLVKSNPSPQYIERISKVFQDNGSGVRGDMKSVIKAILMDEEARSCEWMLNKTSGKLREPMISRFHFLKSLQRISNELGLFNTSYEDMARLRQSPLKASTVFNFFLPDYKPVGSLSEAGLDGPEFQIHDTKTAIEYINIIHETTLWHNLSQSQEEYPLDFELREVRLDLSRFDEFNDDFESLINHLDKFYVHGLLSDQTRQIVRNAINPMKDWEYMYQSHIKLALHLILISPDYTIIK